MTLKTQTTKAFTKFASILTATSALSCIPAIGCATEFMLKPSFGIDVGVRSMQFQELYGKDHFASHYNHISPYMSLQILEHLGVQAGFETSDTRKNIKNYDQATNKNNKKYVTTNLYKFKTYYNKSLINFNNSQRLSINSDQSLLSSLLTTNLSNSLANENLISPRVNSKSKSNEFTIKIPIPTHSFIGEWHNFALERQENDPPLETIFEKRQPASKRNSGKFLKKIATIAKKKSDILSNSYAPSSSLNEKKLNFCAVNKGQDKFLTQNEFLIKFRPNINKIKNNLSLKLDKSPKSFN